MQKSGISSEDFFDVATQLYLCHTAIHTFVESLKSIVHSHLEIQQLFARLPFRRKHDFGRLEPVIPYYTQL